jgi:hypothetical protein
MKMTARISTVVGLLVWTIAVFPLLAQAPAAEGPSPGGFWHGTVALPTSDLEVSIDLEVGEDGVGSATIDIPALGIRYMKLPEATVDGRSVLLRLIGMPGEPTFNGSLSEDGRTIAGNFVQGQQLFPFTLERAAKPEGFGDLSVLYADYERPGTPGEGLVGTWRGLLDIGPIKLRVILVVAAGEDGTLTANVEGVDRNQQVPASSVSLGEDRAVVVDMSSVGVRYTGTMNEDGSEITGEWKERGAPLALTFRRAASE